MTLPLRTKGISFPILLTSGSHTLVEGVDLIQDSIKIILSWILYTREYEDDFGSRIYETLEEPNDEVLFTLVRRFTIDALEKWEKRIEIISLSVERQTPEKISVDLVYRIIELDIRDTLQHYYYINQGV